MKSIIVSLALPLLLSMGCAEVCEDVNTSACLRLGESVSDMCNDSCIANMCKRTCGLCPRKCYTCSEVASPEMCQNTTTCTSFDHKCIAVSNFGSDFSEVYKLGCAPASVCDQNGISTCCSSDLCNNVADYIDYNPNKVIVIGKSIPDRVQMRQLKGDTSNVCSDVDDIACSELFASNSSMCLDDCFAYRLCPRLCGKCYECYECNHIDEPGKCNSTTVCDHDNVCYTLETLSFNLEHTYTLGCTHRQVCDSFSKATSEIFGRRENSVELTLGGGCCHGDLCNHYKVTHTTPQPLTSTTPPPPSTTTTTAATTTTTTRTTPTTTSTTTTARTTKHICHMHDGCPTGYDHNDDYCFKIGSRARSWDDAKAYCEQSCGELAMFHGFSDLRKIVYHAIRKDRRRELHSVLYNGPFYVGAYDPNHTHNWVWNSSGQSVSSSLFGVSPTSGQYCAVVSELTYSLHGVSCTSAYKPLCTARRTHHK